MSEVNTKTRLLESAVKLFAAKGFNGVSVNDICKLSKANIASVNYHFNNKQNLYDEAWQYAVEQIKDPDIVNTNNDIPPEERLHNFIEKHIRHVLGNNEQSFFSKLLLREFAEKNISDLSIIFKTIQPLHDYVTQILRELINNPEKENALPLLRFTLMSQCMMPILSPIAREHLLKVKPEVTINHIYNVMITCIEAEKKR